MALPRSPKLASPDVRRVLLLAVFLLLLYVIVPRLGNFSQSFSTLKHARPLPIIGAGLLVVATYCLATATYWLVALHRLHYGRTLAVQAASAFANRLLPAGLGGLTLNVQYLRRAGHTTAEAAVVAGVNNGLGILGHFLILLVVVVVSGNSLAASFRGIAVPHAGLAAMIMLGVLAVSLLAFRTLRQLIYKTARHIAKLLAEYRHRPLRLLLGLASSCGLTICYALIFYASAVSLGVHVHLLQTFVIFTIGVIAGDATPTPGGLVGAEAGLTAGLVAYGVAAPDALAVALLYRLLTYWLPLAPGFAVFLLTRRWYV